MCYMCEGNYSPLSSAMLESIEPLCKNYINLQGVVISTQDILHYNQTVINISNKYAPMYNMGYVINNEQLYNMTTQDLCKFLLSAFKPFTEQFPGSDRLLVKFVEEQAENKNYPIIKMHHSTNTNDWIKQYTSYSEYDKYNKPIYITSDPGAKYAVGGQVTPHAENMRRQEVDRLPGLTEIVKYPGKFANTPYEPLHMTLERAIIRLNDKDKWTREQIADWLETLDVDITFRSEDAEQV